MHPPDEAASGTPVGTPLDTFPGASNSSIATGVPGFGMPVPGFSPFQIPLPLDLEQSRTHPSTEFLDDPTEGDSLRQLYAETLSKGMWAMNDIDEQGITANSGNGIDEDWVIFMKDCGLV